MAQKKSGYSQAAKNRIKNYSAKQNLQSARTARRRRDNIVAISAGVIAVVFGIGSVSVLGDITATPSPTAVTAATVPDKSVSENRSWTGTMSINGSPMTISLDGAKAPQAVANFVTLAKKGFYNGLNCHRLTTAGIYVLQCGDPKGDGTGGPGYSWGPIENAPPGNTYKSGILAMARQGGNGSSMGSQFFIVYSTSMIPADAAGGYSVFGSITRGSEVLNTIVKGGVAGGGTDGKPAVATTINSIQVQ